MNCKGTVYLVGAGTGDAALLTVRGAELLRASGVVIYDALVNPDLLRLAPKGAELILSGNPAKNRSAEQAEAIRLMKAKSGEGKSVVRLTGGDPYIFGQNAAETAALSAAGISFEVVPGISAFISAPQYPGLPQRPLSGQRVVVTRSRDQAGKLTSQLQERGAQVLEVPTIKIVPPTDLHPLADALLELNSYDWIIFTSANGVTGFFDIFFKGFEDMRDIGGVRIAAVGPATAAKLKELHLKVDLMPAEYVASKIADALAGYESIENLKMLLLRAEVSTPELPKKLEEMGAIVDDIACYKTVPETEDQNGSAAALIEKGADWITFTSGSTVENFHARFDLPKLISQHPELRLASIGPETSKAIRSLGLKPAFEAKEHTAEGLLAGLEKAANK